MGNVFGHLSSIWDQEKTSWAVPHKLVCEPALQKEQKKLIKNFGAELKLCYIERKMLGILDYGHWFVTDGLWTIEFGGGDVLNNKVIVHCNPKGKYTIDCKFPNTEEVKKRMKNVCGATNYSLALRNCEHVARYICYGSWLCFQMVGDGVLKTTFFDHMSMHTKVINTFPDELLPAEEERKHLYPTEQVEWSMDWETHKEALTAEDNNSYNIVVLGPTGSGKSTIINNMFNLTVCKTGGSAESVTRQVKFYQGSTTIQYRNRRHNTSRSEKVKVNVIDTIGFCDSVLSSDQVLEAIKSSVKINLVKIDKVIIVCAGRIELAHQQAIQQFMEWLQFRDYKDNFVLIYNKSDLLSQAQKMENLSMMRSKFEVPYSKRIAYGPNDEKQSIRMNLALGFPENASYQSIREDYISMQTAVIDKAKARIPVDKSHCTIL